LRRCGINQAGSLSRDIDGSHRGGGNLRLDCVSQPRLLATKGYVVEAPE